jgi:hypothetical protein
MGDQHRVTKRIAPNVSPHEPHPLSHWAFPPLHAQQKAASAAGLRQRQTQGERQLSLLPKPI